MMQRLARLSRLRPPPPLEATKHAARLRRGVLSAPGVSGGPGPEAIHLQRVRFVKPKRSVFRRLVPWASVLLVLFIAGTVSIEIVDDEEDDDYEEEEGEEDEEGGVNVRFIPFPFTEKLVRLPNFSPESPERANLEKIRKDKELCKNLEMSLARWALIIYRDTGSLASRFGAPTRARSLINVHFPAAPPPEWSQKGLVITDDSIGWATKQPVDPNVIGLLRRVQWPAQAANAMWKFAKRTLAESFSSILPRTNAPDPSRDPQGVLIGQKADEKRAQVPFPVRRQIPGGAGANPPTADRSKDGASLPPPPGGREVSAEEVAGPGAKPESDKQPGTPHRKSLDLGSAPPAVKREMYPTAVEELMRNLRAIRKPRLYPPPPGCVRFDGIVSVETATSILGLGVVGHYNPKTRKWDGRSLRITLREISVKA